MSNQYGCYSIEWTREMNIQIMEEMRKRKALWDICSSEYKEKFRKQKDYEELANMFSVPASEIEKKIHNLKSQFRREYRRCQLRSSSSPYKSKWYGFKFMMFLKESENYHSSKIIKKYKKSSSSTGSTSETIITDLPSSTVPASPNKVSTSLEKQLDNRDEFKKSKDLFYKIMKSKENEHKLTRDEHTVFGEYVTHELKKIGNPYILTVTKHKIQEALFEGHMSMFSSACDFTENNEYLPYASQNTEDSQNTPSSVYSFSPNLSPTPSPPLLEQNEIQ